MDVDNLMFYSQAPSNDGVDELRDDVELFSSVRDDEIESSVMLLECLSGISEGSLGALNDFDQDEEREEQLDAVKAVDLHEQISTNKPPEIQYFSRYDEDASFAPIDDDASVLLPSTLTVADNFLPLSLIHI